MFSVGWGEAVSQYPPRNLMVLNMAQLHALCRQTKPSAIRTLDWLKPLPVSST